MKYLQEGPVLDRRGEPIVIPSTEPIEVTVSWLLDFLMKQYMPTPDLTLQPAEVRLYNKALDAIEAGPENGWFGFEDSHFDLMRKVCMVVAPRILLTQISLNTPQIEDMFTSAYTNG
jgi:hypothetical protein